MSKIAAAKSAKILRDELKALRTEHASKPISRMTEAELADEIDHHETACKARVLKSKRLEALAKAREARSAPKAEKAEKVEVKVPAIRKAKAEVAVKDEPKVESKPVKKGLISME